jgi:hypothetical protein
MAEEGINANIESLQRIGIKARRDIFVTDVFKEI